MKPASDLCQLPVKMADSKPRLVISLKRKIKLIEEVEANPHKLKKAIADEQQISPATLSNILENREKYKEQFYSGDNLLKKRDKACQHGEVDAELLKWLKGLRCVLPEYAHAHSPLPPPPLPPLPTPPSLSLSLSLGTSRPKLTCACQKQNGHLVQCVLSHMLLLSFRPPRWPCGKASASRAEDPGFESRLRRDFSGSSHTSDFKIGTPVATPPGAWRYRVSTGTGRPDVSILNWVRQNV